MKTNRSTYLLTATLGLAVLATAGCTDKATTATGVPGATVASSTAISDTWAEVKDCTYDMRAQFVAGVARMETKVNDQVSVLTTKRAGMTNATDTKAWDFAMKEMSDAQSSLKSCGAELGQATSDNWNQAKDKVSQAWVRTQDAYTKVKASTTT